MTCIRLKPLLINHPIEKTAREKFNFSVFYFSGGEAPSLLAFPPHLVETTAHPTNIYLFKVNDRNTTKRCEICPKLTIKKPERRQQRRSGVFIVNFEHISHLFLAFLLLDVEQVNVNWVESLKPILGQCSIYIIPENELKWTYRNNREKGIYMENWPYSLCPLFFIKFLFVTK